MMGEDCPEKSAHDKSHSECRAKLAAPAPQPASSDIPKERIRPPGSTQRSCNSLFPCTMCRPNLSFARTLTTNVRSRAESDHGLQEVPRMEKEPMWRAVYASRFVFLSARAVAFGESNRAENRHIPRGTNASIARIGGRVRISANAVCQDSPADWT